MTAHLDSYRNRAVLVTGGLGFIGSNLCRRLADLGARVTAVDSLLPDPLVSACTRRVYDARLGCAHRHTDCLLTAP